MAGAMVAVSQHHALAGRAAVAHVAQTTVLYDRHGAVIAQLHGAIDRVDRAERRRSPGS